MASRVAVAVLALGAVLVAVFAGWSGLAVYLFFAIVVGAVALGASVGAGWLEDASRSRFRDRGR